LIPVSPVTAILVGVCVLMLAVHLTTIYVHRSVAHGGVRYAPALETGLHTAHLMLTGVKVRQWTAVHLYHHAFPDKPGNPGDPHSPQFEGMWHIVFFNVYYYAKAAKDPRVLAHPMVQARLSRIPKRTMDKLGLFGPAILWIGAIVLFGWRGGLIAGLTYFIPYLLLNGAVNGIAHYRGQKNFPAAAGFNVRSLALMTGGEGLHNNHHARFTSPFFAHRRHERLLDSGGLIIRALTSMGLATVSTAPES